MYIAGGETQPSLWAAGNAEVADAWRELARKEDEKYTEHRQRSNDTAFLGSNIGRRQEHLVRNTPQALTC